MADDDSLRELRQLVEAAEHEARPLPADEVRARGTRRRRRRHAAVSGLALVLTLAVGYGTLVGSGLARVVEEPSVAQSPAPSASPAPVRTVTATNLPTAAELPAPPGAGTVQEWPDGARPLAEVSVCAPDGLGALGASAAVSRSYKTVYTYGPGEQPDPDAPMVREPDSYAVALQFPDEAAAEAAAATYRGWLTDCRAGRGAGVELAVVDTLGFGWTRVEVPRGSAEVAEVVYREPGSSDEAAYWESSGLTRVGDRLMLTVTVSYTNESSWSLDPKPDDGSFPHPQLGMVRAAAERLAVR